MRSRWVKAEELDPAQRMYLRLTCMICHAWRTVETDYDQSLFQHLHLHPKQRRLQFRGDWPLV